MNKHVCKGVLYEFVDLGIGMILEVLSSREPILTTAVITDRAFLCKSSYVVDVLIGEQVHRINFSVHYYHPEGDPTGWWSHIDPPKVSLGTSGWYGVNWLK